MMPLLLKQLNKFYRKENVQWVNLIWDKYYRNSVPHLSREKGSFWWKDNLRLHIYYRGVAICSPGRGDTIGFWEVLTPKIGTGERLICGPNLVTNPVQRGEDFFRRFDRDACGRQFVSVRQKDCLR
jgi:hypothetical protein